MDNTNVKPNALVRNRFKPNGRATLIGSLPLAGHKEALDWIFAATPDIPLWPQLPGNPYEGMLRQFIEGFPGIIEKHDSVIFDTSAPKFEEEMLTFFEAFLVVTENPEQLSKSMFAMGKERGAGLISFIETAQKKNNIKAVKGQITGPFTMLTSLTDAAKRLAYYDPMMREIIVKGLAARAAWQCTILSQLDLPVIIFIDEPALAGLGSSSFIGVSSEDITEDLTEVISAIQGAGGLAGIHVCANTDWSLLLSLNLDVLSFDAYSYFDRLLTCRKQTLAFLEQGGILAWGIVPTGEAENIMQENHESLAVRWEENAQQLGGRELSTNELLARSLITPSCGTGSLTPELAQRVLNLTRETSSELIDKFAG